MKKLLTLGLFATMALTMSVASLAKPIPVDLKAFLNSPGMSPLDVEVSVGLDVDNGQSWANFDSAYFPKGGGEIASNMGAFKFVIADPALELDNVECDGQTIPVAPDFYKTLYIAATNHHGASEDAPITLKYDDGTTTTGTISVSDWCGAAKYDETAVVEMDHRVNLDGSSGSINCYLFGMSVKVNPDKKLVAVILPKETDDFTAKKLHVFAATLETK